MLCWFLSYINMNQPQIYICPGFPGGARGKEPTCYSKRHKRHRFNPWVGKIPWRRTWQSTPAFLPRESHGQRNLVGYSPWGCTESDTTKETQHSTAYICPLPFEPPSHLIPPLQAVADHQAELPALYRNFPLAIYFTHGNVNISKLLPQFVPPSPSSCVSISLFSISDYSCPAVTNGNVPRTILVHQYHFSRFHIYALIVFFLFLIYKNFQTYPKVKVITTAPGPLRNFNSPSTKALIRTPGGYLGPLHSKTDGPDDIGLAVSYIQSKHSMKCLSWATSENHTRSQTQEARCT